MKYRIVFSLPIHEHFEVVLDQILNITTLNAECAIIIHESPAFDYGKSVLSREQFLTAISNLGLEEYVYINPVKVRTGMYDIIQAHLSNFSYASQNLDFHFFSMLASNELFIKPGLYDEIKDFDCGLNHKPLRSVSNWAGEKLAYEDNDLSSITKATGEEIYISQVEGSFYRKDIFQMIFCLITKYFDYKNITSKYAREEIYFPTCFWGLNKDHKYKVCHNFTFVPWKRASLFVNFQEIKMNEKRGSSKYSVKRVERVINDDLRSYIRQHCHYFEKEKKYINIKKVNVCSLYSEEFFNTLKRTVKEVLSFLSRKRVY